MPSEPPEPSEPEIRPALSATRRWTMVALSTVGVFSGVRHLIEGHKILGVLHVSMGGLLWVVYRKYKETRWFVLLVGLLALMTLFGTSLLWGLWRSPSLWFVPVVLLFAGYLTDRRSVLFWVVAVGGVLVAAHYVAPSFVAVEVQPGQLDVFFARLLLGGVLFALARSARADEEANAQALLRSREAMREQAERLAAQAQELRAARDEALRAVRAKDTFLANMSHELRTPLNAVIGLADLLVDTRLDEQQKEYVEVITKSSHALLELIGDILDMSKLEAGRLEPEARPFDLSACVEDAIDLVETQASSKGLDLQLDLDPEAPLRITSDLARLRQVLVNLLSNAVKFTPAGTVWVRVQAKATGPGQVELRFEVQDTGIGIPQDRMNRLFLPFSQADVSTTREFGGSGLGLAISRALVELLGGTFWVESEVGRGSTFAFTLLAEVDEAALWRPMAGLRALVVDGRPDARAAAARMLRGLGASVAEAAAEEEALEAAQRGPLDVLFVDLSLPSSSGAPLAVALRRRLPSCRVLALAPRSAHGRAALAGDPIELLPRPLGRAALSKHLSQARPDQDAEVTQSGPSSSLRVLVVEDNPVNRRVLLKMLERLGHRAEAVDSGAVALDRVRRQRFHVILLDVNMPGMDGYEVAGALCKEFPASQRPRIIGATANALPGDRERCLSAGMDDYLSKPIELSVLSGVLAPVLPGVAADKSSRGHSSLLDPVLLQKIREAEGDARLLQLASEFTDLCPGLMDGLVQAAGAERKAESVEGARALNQHARALGAIQLSAHLSGVEIVLQEGDAGELPRLMGELQRVFLRTYQAVVRLSSNLRESGRRSKAAQV